MNRQARFLILLCAVAIAGLLALQFYWIRNYYAVNKAGFEKEVNLAFEDAIKKEFSLRCDTVEQLIVGKLMDTDEFAISSVLRDDHRTWQYNIANKHDEKDRFSVSFPHFNIPLAANDTIARRRIATLHARNLRSEDLDHHTVYYNTRNLGSFINEKVRQYDFDTARLRPVLSYYLAQRGIAVPFQFYMRANDSTMNNSLFPKELLAKYPVITKSYPTYKLADDGHYVRALFTDPFFHIISKMKFVFISSFLLIVIVLASVFLLVRMWFREKRLSLIKSDFIANITHEFKTPIATVSAAVEALLDFDALEDKEKTGRYLRHSKNELQRLSGLVDQLLTMSIYENNKVECRPEQIRIEETVGMIVQSHLVAAAKPIHLSFTNNTAVEFIKADRSQFHHAINNVIDNAVKYSGAAVTISIECMVKDHFLVLSVTDNGRGISSKELPFVFDKFYRVKAGNDHSVKGYGLGLNYVQNILNLHGGWCLLKSKLGQGSVVSLAWPI
ncbi:MAG: HAMP domain-containing sensor histidine kinase [Puia sp.]|nr:HAMP domain-containing sensor histidine kinase [Puia sp.]